MLVYLSACLILCLAGRFYSSSSFVLSCPQRLSFLFSLIFFAYIQLIRFTCFLVFLLFFFSKQKTAYELRIRDWSSDVCSSDLRQLQRSLPLRVFFIRRRRLVGRHPDREGLRMSAVTALDTPPSSTDISNFSVRGDAFRADMQTMTPQVNALNVEAAATVVALTSSNAPIAAATAVATPIVSATKWVAGSYDADVSVWSPTDFQTYISLADGVGATDPASDPAHWRCVTLRPASAALVDPSFVDGLSVSGGLTALDTASVDTLAASGTNDTMQDLLSNTLDCATRSEEHTSELQSLMSTPY